MAFKWFFVRCQSGREKRIRDNAINRLKVAGCQDVIPQVIMPYELVTDMKRGKKRTVEQKLYPGYLMVQADLDTPEDPQVIKARTALRSIDGLRDFLGPRGEPTALSEAEVPSILVRMTDSETRRGRGRRQSGEGDRKGDRDDLRTSDPRGPQVLGSGISLKWPRNLQARSSCSARPGKPLPRPPSDLPSVRMA